MKAPLRTRPTTPRMARKRPSRCRNELEYAFDDAIEALVRLRASPIVLRDHFDRNDPDHIDALSALTRDAAAGLDFLFYEIARAGGFGDTRADRMSHRFQVSSALDNNLDFELHDRANLIRADATQAVDE